MKALYLTSLAAAVLLASCAKEALTEKPEVSTEKTYLTVGLLPQSKTYLDSETSGSARQVYWSNGDAISVNGYASDELEDIEPKTSSVNFSLNGVLSTPYSVLYPASAYDDSNHITLPAVQTYKAGGFADGMCPMAGYTASGSNLSLNHLCAILQIKIKRETAAHAEERSGTVDEDNILAVRFKGRASEKVSGTFEIDYGDGTYDADLTAATGSDGDLEVRVVKSQATATDKVCTYFIVVPARTYANGFDVIIQDVNGDIMTKSKTSSKDLVAGHLYDMAEFAFIPSGTETGIEISNEQELIDFAIAYNNNEYADLGSSLIATVTDNITFDAESSALFNATGGIGTPDNGHGDTNYFNGIFDGGNHTISGLEATVPLFAYTGGGGDVKNLTLSSTCSYTVGTSSGNYHGALVGRNKGTVKDCTSNANVIINNIQDVNSADQLYGGLVGYNPGGTIDGCTVTGNIVCSQTGQSITANNAYIGGIAGYQSSDGGTINDCKFQGNITVSDATTYGGITADGKYFYVGGILGYCVKCTITACTAGVDGEARAIDIRGSMVPSIGGIVAWNVNAESSEISGNCKNYMSLSFASNGTRANTTPCRIGGIVARTAAPVSNCDNYGAISTSCNSTTIELGGIAGESAGAKISGCTNHSGGSITRSNANQTGAQANRYIYLGGTLGTLNASADIENCENNANITCNVIGTSSATTVDMGGILGGGNASQVDISGCTNDGEIKFDNDNASAAAITRTALGGILGNASTAGTTVTECGNEGKVWCNNNAAGSYGPIAIGGTIGQTAASSSVTDCTNSGKILCVNGGQAATTTVDLGGIVGSAIGKVVVSGTNSGDVSNTQEIEFDNSDASAVAIARSAVGGIIGYNAAAETSVTKASNSGKVWCNNNTAGSYGPIAIGGAIGQTAASSSVTDCTNSGEILCQNPGAAITAYVDLGGIVGLAEDTITISGTTADATLNSGPVTVSQASSAIVYARNTQGGILGYGKGNNTKITKCKNTAKIYCNLSGAKANGRPSYTGGIVGLLASLAYTNDAASGLSALSGVEIGNCNNTGEVNSTNYNNNSGNKNSPFAGGIVGLISAKTTKGYIHDCAVGTQTVYAYRGTSAGLVAYANYCKIEDNTSAADMSGTNATVNGTGGIVGRLFDSSMSNCTFSGKIAKAKNIGGLAYTVSDQTTGSTITDCKVNGATLTTGTDGSATAAAVLVSITDNKTNSISNCGVKGTLDGAGITLSSNMITTDGGATVTGTYLIP